MNCFRDILIRWCKKAENYIALLHRVAVCLLPFYRRYFAFVSYCTGTDWVHKITAVRPQNKSLFLYSARCTYGCASMGALDRMGISCGSNPSCRGRQSADISRRKRSLLCLTYVSAPYHAAMGR